MKTLRRNERHDTDRAEAKLISVGHHLIRFARLKGLMVSERSPFWEAAEIVWQAKREYRVELKARRAARAVTARAAFAELRRAASVPQPRNAMGTGGCEKCAARQTTTSTPSPKGRDSLANSLKPMKTRLEWRVPRRSMK
jgi:hypothetical protein